MNEWPNRTTTQQTAQVYLTAEREAESDAKKMIWFFIGFLGSILGILIAFYL